MRNHSLIVLLKTFTREETKLFDDFIASQYFNRRSAVRSLYSAIIEHYPSFTESLAKEELFKILFPGKKYNDSTFRVLISTLNELAMRFITQRYFENDKGTYNLYMLRAMCDRSFYKGIEKIFNNCLKDSGAQTLEASYSYYLKYNVGGLRNSYLADLHEGIYEKFLDKPGISNGIEDLTNYYYTRLLKNYVVILNLEMIYKKQFDTLMFEKTFQFIDRDYVRRFPVIEIYYYLVWMLKDRMNEEYYYKVKKIMNENIGALGVEDLREILINMQNFCTRMVSVGTAKFYTEKFELSKQELKYKTYLVSGKMSPVYFMSLVALGLKVNESKWVKNFIEKYSPELSKENKSNAYNFGLAHYEFAMKNFEKSLEHLSLIKFEELYQKLEVKVLQMMIYYEMDYESELLSYFEAFRHFMSNNRLIPKNKFTYYNNFYRAIRKLQKIRKSGDKFELKLFRDNFLKDDNFMNKKWIIEKTNMLDSA